MAVGDIFQVTQVLSVMGQRCVNVLHFKESTACTDQIPARSIAAMYEDVFAPALQLCLSDEVEIQCIYARRIRPTLDIPFLIVESAMPGLVASHTAPPNAAGIVSFYTAVPSRSGRGRAYISGIPESRISDALMEPTQVTALGVWADLFLNPQAPPAPYDGEWRGVVFSPALNAGNNIIGHVISPSMGTIMGRRSPYGMIT